MPKGTRSVRAACVEVGGVPAPASRLEIPRARLWDAERIVDRWRRHTDDGRSAVGRVREEAEAAVAEPR
jgi:hypothetical protein